jgi:hypothetical protein
VSRLNGSNIYESINLNDEEIDKSDEMKILMKRVSMKFSEGNDDISQKCEWCSKPVSKGTWDEYCSFRCNAAGRYRMFVFLAIIGPMILVIMVIVLVMMGIDSWTYLLIRPGLLFPPLIIIGLSIFFIYGTYVGRILRNERQVDAKES